MVLPACCAHRPWQVSFVQSRPLHSPRGAGSDGDGLTYLGEQLAQAQQRRRDDRVPEVRGREQHPSNLQVNELERRPPPRSEEGRTGQPVVHLHADQKQTPTHWGQ